MAHVTFTNLKCSVSNKTLFDYKHCYIKAINRTHKYLTFNGKLYIKNLNNITVSIEINCVKFSSFENFLTDEYSVKT